ncbi:MAG: hypothetical protein OXC02_06270 [Rhodobacteraceae bacterium]|nr:hypothetical protein [Paracoccaceae bacterium]
MNDLPGYTQPSSGQQLRKEFLKWQCRVRQIIIREHSGQPDESITPEVSFFQESRKSFRCVTVLNRNLSQSVNQELIHMNKANHDLIKRREKAIQFFGERYYQKPDWFSDILTSTFVTGSERYQSLVAEKRCMLQFNAFNHEFNLACRIKVYQPNEHSWQATYWHNLLYNPYLLPTIAVIGFVPDWDSSYFSGN